MGGIGNLILRRTMSRPTICDACKRTDLEFENPPVHYHLWTKGAWHRFSIGMTDLDVCRDCWKKFQEFVKTPQIGEVK